MTGWKTWVGIAVMVTYGVGGWTAGLHDAATMINYLIGAWTALGLGHKIEKSGVNITLQAPLQKARAGNETLDNLIRDNQRP